ncbi:7397_t:CDS:2 [Diversispora eburnea]|uniref:7397_t:CDS:1 n=1 Tax=Diversispora eburnea TaxID=1213867 RepID=A0A9N8VJF7_9GLOM|nr:7397_t:CDS:2 [Diversispora eburnea]
MWRREDGLEPFIGVIVTPYDEEHESNVSRFQFWVSGSNYDLSGQFITPSETLPEEMFSQLSGLVEEYQNYDQRVDMTESFRDDDDISKLDKLMESLSSHISVSSSATEEFILRVKELMNTDFLPKEKSHVKINAKSNAECHNNFGDSTISKEKKENE